MGITLPGAGCEKREQGDADTLIFQDNGNAVLVSPALLELTPETMVQLLMEPLRVTSETVIFKALVKW
ncbi:hypothetical protein E2C01_044118 [Portunus trituberculatus]|uniref:BACK domain-containing protein n=1 Tax=Portunus trituberculatus TaxID=210409 RepID=A0A5B7G1E8_PORTR|nr:hypothetical protein [Portunus trituberculatus]